jgi:phospholipase C
MKHQSRKRLMAFVSVVAMMANTVAPMAASAATAGPRDEATATPIQHVIIIVGENRTFDHLFATYVPPTGSVVNLLSEGIVKADGTPGPNAALATQYSAVDTTTFSIAPGGKVAYTQGGSNAEPPIMTGGAPTAASNSNPPPFATVKAAKKDDKGLESSDYTILTTGATGLPTYSIDTRYPGAATPPNGPFQLTPHITYDDYAASPVHRFYQMFQQMDCSAANATKANPSGCLNDLFPWVEVTIGAGSNGESQPAGFNNQSTGEGSTSMGFYNVQQGDAPYFKSLADTYAIGDNYHQPLKGGTGADSVVLGFGTTVYYQDANGNAATPPANQIENPNPQPGTNNWYTQDGYGGGTYTNCADASQPAVANINSYLSALSYTPAKACAPNTYYLLNNYNPGYNPDGSLATLGPNNFTIPPQHQTSIANILDDGGVSWAYYGEGWDAAVSGSPLGAVLCQICNPFQYSSYVMTNEKKRKENLLDASKLYKDLASGKLPAVSYVKPSGFNDGHPSSSKYDIFEAFVKKIIDGLQANPTLWASTAVFITNDEGGGYYDSGFEQTLDFFGDGTRIPLIVVSPYSKGVGPVHEYGDHASILKFIEANWNLPPISAFTRDALPNPTTASGNAYVPTNMPAIGDLTSYFNFSADAKAKLAQHAALLEGSRK